MGVVLGAVDVGPRRRVQHEARGGIQWGRGERDVPVLVRQGDEVFGREFLLQRAAELPAGASYEDGGVSRSDRIGDFVLQRSRTRGSSHGRPCSSASVASYSSLT